MTPAINNQQSTINLSAGTWDSARRWINHAAQFEKLKLFSQVMLGLDLIALKKQHGVQHGGARSHSGILNSDEGWESTLHKETGLSRSTASRLELMATAAMPRLKKLAALKDFDPASQSVALLPAPQKEALEKAVVKITDGYTQQEFGELFCGWKSRSKAAGRAPGEGGKKKLALSEQAELYRQQAEQDWFSLDKSLRAYGAKFTFLNNDEVLAQLSVLEKAIKARRAWLAQSPAERDTKAIEALLK